MKIPLKARLKTVLSFVVGDILADIGTDHAYLPIAACFEGRVVKALACDIRSGPLEIAAQNITRYGFDNIIETRLGFGLQPIKTGEADCAVIAGMGGINIIEILRQSPAVVKEMKRFILQPQHDIPAVRRALHEMGFFITDEIVLQDKKLQEKNNDINECRNENDKRDTKGRFYTVIVADNGYGQKIPAYTEMEYALGKHSLERKDEVLFAYVEHELHKIYRIMDFSAGRAQLGVLMGMYEEVLSWQ